MEKFEPIESRALKFWHTKLKSARRSMRSLAKEEGDNKELDWQRCADNEKSRPSYRERIIR
jgi:hypothetical protein